MGAEKILEDFRYYTGEHNHARYTEIQSAYEYVLKKTKWWNTRIRKEDLITLVADTYKYKVDFSCFRGGSPTHIYIKSASTDVWDLIEESKFDSFEDSRPSENGVTTGSNTSSYPTQYFLTGDQEFNFYVTPTPSQSTDIRFDGTLAIPKLDRGVELIVHRDYHDSIARLAAADFLDLKSEATQGDAVKAAKLKKRAMEGLKSLADDMHPNRTENLSWNAGPLYY